MSAAYLTDGRPTAILGRAYLPVWVSVLVLVFTGARACFGLLDGLVKGRALILTALVDARSTPLDAFRTGHCDRMRGKWMGEDGARQRGGNGYVLLVGVGGLVRLCDVILYSGENSRKPDRGRGCMYEYVCLPRSSTCARRVGGGSDRDWAVVRYGLYTCRKICGGERPFCSMMCGVKEAAVVAVDVG